MENATVKNNTLLNTCNVADMFSPDGRQYIFDGCMEQCAEKIQTLCDNAFLYGNRLFNANDYNILNLEDRKLILWLKNSISAIVTILNKYEHNIWHSNNEEVIIDVMDAMQIQTNMESEYALKDQLRVLEYLALISIVHSRPNYADEAIYKEYTEIYFHYTVIRELIEGYNRDFTSLTLEQL